MIKTAAFLILCGALACAQDYESKTGEQKDGFVAKVLRPLEPDAKTPPSAHTRFKEFEGDIFGPYAVLRQAANAGLDMGLDGYHEWGQGVRGYAERFGNGVATNGAHHAIGYGLESVLHEDNRYFASGQSSFGGRMLHAASSVFVTHHDDGSAGFSYSNVIGAAGAGFLSRTWAPRSERGAGHALASVGVAFGEGAAVNSFREFVPDIIRMFHGR